LTLDDVLERLGIVEVDLLKMNIEGAELAALRGFSRLASVRHVVIACHDYRATQGRGSDAMRTNAAVRTLIEGAGFEIFSRDNDPRPWVRDYVYGTRVA
jgi:Methyltransferase FkbM domain